MKLLLTLLLLKFPLIGQQVVNWTPEMGHTYQNGQLWYQAEIPNGPHITVTVQVNGRFTVATLGIVNRSERNVDVVPEHFTITLVQPKPKNLDYVPVRKVVGNVDGIVAATGIISGLAQASAENRKQQEQQIRDQAQAVTNGAIRATTLAPGQEISGALYFKRESACAKGCSMVLRVPVGDTVFEFPVAFGATQKL